MLLLPVLPVISVHPVSPVRRDFHCHLCQSPGFITTLHITRFLAQNVLPDIPVIHTFVLIVDIICIGPITRCLTCNGRPVFQI